MKIQWKPNWIPEESRLCLTRLCWNRGIVGDGKGYSTKLSISVCQKWRDLWIGLYIDKHPFSSDGYMLWFCLVPCFPIRISLQRSFGGLFCPQWKIKEESIQQVPANIDAVCKTRGDKK